MTADINIPSISVPIEVPDIKTEVVVDDPSILCNCFAYVKKQYPNLPRTQEIKQNLTEDVGDLAVFYYPNSGLYHYASVSETDGFSFKIKEANYKRCQETTREINTDYPYLLGFYHL